MTDTVPSLARALGEIETPRASRYLQQICKHFAHKIPVEFDATQGSIGFSVGECRLTADDARLRLDLSAPDGSQLTQLKDVVIRHLVRFAFREELAIAWQDG